MVASNYMNATEYDSIWKTSFAAAESTRFAHIGVRVAEFINFKINHDATEQIVDTAFTPVLEQFTEEVCLLLVAAAKIEKTVQPWDFITSITMRFLKDHYELYREEFYDIRESLSKQWHYTESGTLRLPGYTDT